MRIIQPTAEILGSVNGEELIRHIERCGRVCYKSEDKITSSSAETFCRGIIKRGHEAVLEHASVTVKFTVDRGVSHEIVRHRLAAYCQESTRYCNYTGEKFGKEITVIKPLFWPEDSLQYRAWRGLCETAEETYFGLMHTGAKPEEARAVLPNSLKTEVVMTANLREWRHFFKLRTAPAAHPQMRQVAIMALALMKAAIPVIFDDIETGKEPEQAGCSGDACDITRLLGKAEG
ncbi:MAG: FAD-dependent thymidylate synthase [Treponema sp.]|nr:FAD-dependent thymidylate synthase [Treponema sp.]